MDKNNSKMSAKPPPARDDRRSKRRGKRPRGQKATQLPSIQTLPTDRRAASTTIDDSVFIVFDIETTGGNPEKNGITEICALKVKHFTVIDRFYSMVNPQIPIPPIVRKMTGITNKMVRDAPKIDDVMPKFVDFIGNGILVSHNTIGDMKFLRYYSEDVLKKPIGNFFMCTHLLVERLIPEAPNKSLRGLADFLQLKTSGDMHRADADAEVTLELFKILVQKLEQRNIERVEDGIRFQGDYESGMRLGWAIDRKVVEELPSSPGVFSLYDLSGRLHFLSSALNLRRDVNKLLRFTQIPRPMLRLVLSSYRLDYEACSSQFAALRKESAELVQRHVDFVSANWHQRVANAVFFKVDKAHATAGVGPLEEGTTAAFGPISDRKETKALLEKVIKACGGRASKHGFYFDKSYLPIVVGFFKGLLPDIEAELLRQQNSLFARLSSKFGGDRVAPLIDVVKKLHHIEHPTLDSLLEVTGIVLVKPVEERTKIQLYRIHNAQIIKQTEIEGDLNQIQADQDFLDRERRALAKLRKRAVVRPLSDKECLAVNSLLWWIYSSSSKKEGIFIAL